MTINNTASRVRNAVIFAASGALILAPTSAVAGVMPAWVGWLALGAAIGIIFDMMSEAA